MVNNSVSWINPMVNFSALPKRWIYGLVLLALLLPLYYPLFSFTQVPANMVQENRLSEYMFAYVQVPIIVKSALMEEHAFPLWNKWTWSGTPYLGIPNKFIFYPGFLAFIFLPTFAAILNYSLLFHVLLAGVGTYWLGKYLFDSDEAALISTLVFLSSGFFFGALSAGLVDWTYGAALVPWFYLFLFKLLREPQKIKYALLVALALSLQFYTGMVQYFLYDLLAVPVFFLFFAVTEEKTKLKRNLSKSLLFMALVGVFMLAFIAPKLLPDLAYVSLSNRQILPPVADFPGLLQSGKEAFFQLVQMNFFSGTNDSPGAIGLIPFLLALFSLSLFRRDKREKKVGEKESVANNGIKHLEEKQKENGFRNITLFMWLMVLISLALVSASPLYQLIIKLPGVNLGRGLARFFISYSLPLSLLAGLGAVRLAERLVGRGLWKNLPEKLSMALNRFNCTQKQFWLLLIGALVFINIIFFNYPFRFEKSIEAEERIPVLSYLQNRTASEPFRVANFGETNIDDSMAHYHLHYGLESYMGFDGAMWLFDYLNGILAQQMRWESVISILNVKSVVTSHAFNLTTVSGMKQIYLSPQECTFCKPIWVSGPYVYENTQALPRASFFNEAVLVMGSREKTLSFFLIRQSEFNPQQLLLVGENSLKGKRIEELGRYKAIIVADLGIRPEEAKLLWEYQQGGGKVIPRQFANIFNGSEGNVLGNATNFSYTSEVLKEFKKLANSSHNSSKGYVPASHLLYHNNHREYDIHNLSSGFLLLSEKFYMFPEDWKESEGRALLKADGGITAIWIDKEHPPTLKLNYFPASLRVGLIIFGFGLFLIAVLLALNYFSRGRLDEWLEEEVQPETEPPKADHSEPPLKLA